MGREEWQGHSTRGPALSCSQVLHRPCRGGHRSMLLPPLTCSVPTAEWLAVPATLPRPRPAPALTPTNPTVSLYLHLACMRAKSLQLCLTLCTPMDYRPTGSFVHGILQARILEWIVMPSSRECSRLRDRTRV